MNIRGIGHRNVYYRKKRIFSEFGTERVSQLVLTYKKVWLKVILLYKLIIRLRLLKEYDDQVGFYSLKLLIKYLENGRGEEF